MKIMLDFEYHNFLNIFDKNETEELISFNHMTINFNSPKKNTELPQSRFYAMFDYKFQNYLKKNLYKKFHHI